MSVLELSKRSGVAYSTYWFIRTGRIKTPSKKTLTRYAAGLAGPSRQMARSRSSDSPLIRATFRGHMVAIAVALGLDPSAVLASEPARRAVHDPAWAAAARVRMLAMYCTTVGLGIPYATLARAIGMTKQAVSWNVARARDLEDDRKYGPIMEAASRLVTARPLGAELGALWED